MNLFVSYFYIFIINCQALFLILLSSSIYTSFWKCISPFAHQIVTSNHRVSSKNSTHLITSTFKQAFQSRNAPQSLLFHSDQGAQYTSKTFCKLLRMNKVVQSFSEPGRPHDNAVMESFFASMKREEIYRMRYTSEQQFIKSVNNYMEFYNTQRPHSTLNYKTPNQFERLHEVREETEE